MSLGTARIEAHDRPIFLKIFARVAESGILPSGVVDGQISLFPIRVKCVYLKWIDET